MEHMAEAMASMAETCDTMMQREMAGYPWKMAAIAVLALLAAMSLALFVVLEILCIRFFYLRITQMKNESRLPPKWFCQKLTPSAFADFVDEFNSRRLGGGGVFRQATNH
ncbi:MAG: hypothetical protein DCC68_22625 [Planctomycetota bacterium]|nr:MAG: hypothetical protein DCC68_22625 [Planctomycetota bacterium]